MTGLGRISYLSNYLLKVIVMVNFRSIVDESFRRSVRIFHVAILSVMTLYGIKMNDSLTSSVIEESRDDIDGTRFIPMNKIQS